MALQKRSVKILPTQVPNALRQAVTLQKKGRPDQAKQVLLAILKDHPKNFDALNLLGVQAAIVGDNSAALGLFKKALKVRPNDVKALVNLAKVEYQLKDYKPSVTHFQKALKLAPGEAGIWSLLGRTFHTMGNLDEALAHSTKACELEPENKVFALSRANFLVDAGEIEQARTEYYRIAEGKDNYEVAALIGIANITKFAPDAPEPTRLAHFVHDPATVAYHGPDLIYATAKSFADRKEYDRAFEYYKLAKDKFGRTFEQSKFEVYCQNLKTAFDRSYFETQTYAGDPTVRPVFIVGMPRSGTTLTEQICASHQDVAGAGELKFLRQTLRRLGIYDNDPPAFSKIISDLTPAELDRIGKEYLSILDEVSKSASRVVDKMPLNFEALGLIATLFPNAKIIHCTRDPIDTCLSCYMNKFTDSHSYNTHLRTLGQFYREYNDLMAHWADVLPLKIQESAYEHLTTNQEDDTRKIIDHLGLDWDPACLDFSANKQLVLTPSKWQVRQPIYKSSVKKWKNYEKHLGPLIDALGDLAKVD